MPESAKEGDSVLPEGSDIGLGPGDRAFEPHYSDQKPSEINDFRGLFLFFVYCGAGGEGGLSLKNYVSNHLNKWLRKTSKFVILN